MIAKRWCVPSLTLLAIFGAGCSREPAAQMPPAQNFAAPAQSAPAAAAVPAPSAAPGTHRAEELTPAPPAGAAVPAQDTSLRRRDGTYVERSRPVDDRPRYVTKRRSKKKSAAIIGGSAAAGAGIGALAGGGKGAAIGAIGGAVGGLIYDRSTAKKRERVQ